jgi:hypothetical protein
MNWQYNERYVGKNPKLSRVCISLLNTMYPFDLDVAGLIHKIQMGILVFDFALSGLVLIAGAIRFARDV